MLPGCDVDAAREIADRLRADMPQGLRASAGATGWAAAMSADELVVAADRALYRAKRNGRGQTVV